MQTPCGRSELGLVREVRQRVNSVRERSRAKEKDIGRNQIIKSLDFTLDVMGRLWRVFKRESMCSGLHL